MISRKAQDHCINCSKKIHHRGRDFVSFDDPRIKCPYCGKTTYLPEVMEWKAREKAEQILIIIDYYVKRTLFLLFGWTALIYLLLALIPAIWDSSYNDTFKNIDQFKMFIIIVAILSIVILIYQHRHFTQAVKESNKRMENISYANEIMAIREFIISESNKSIDNRTYYD